MRTERWLQLFVFLAHVTRRFKGTLRQRSARKNDIGVAEVSTVPSEGSIDCSDQESFSSTLVDEHDIAEKSGDKPFNDLLTYQIHGKVQQCDENTPMREVALFKGYTMTLYNSISLKSNDLSNTLEFLLTVFPHKQGILGAENLYAGIFKLVKTSDIIHIKQRALQLLLIQIRSGRMMLLVQVLTEQPPEDIHRLLVELMACLPNSWIETHREDIHVTLQKLWKANHHDDIHIRAHSATPFVQFLLQLVHFNYTAACAVHKAGFIDMLICMCNNNFPDARMPTADTSRWLATSSLLSLCISMLEALLKYPNIERALSTSLGSLASAWPVNHSRDIAKLRPILSQFEPLRHRRRNSFKRLGELPGAPQETLQNTCGDLFNLSRRALYDEDIVQRALTLILEQLCSDNREEVWACLSNQIMQTPYKIVVDLFFDLLRLLLRRCSSLPVGSSTPNCKWTTGHFLDFVGYATKESYIIRTALQEAGIACLGYPINLWPPWACTIVPQAFRERTLQFLDTKFYVEQMRICKLPHSGSGV